MKVGSMMTALMLTLGALCLSGCSDEDSETPCGEVCACVCGSDGDCRDTCLSECTETVRTSDDAVRSCEQRSEVVQSGCDHLCSNFAAQVVAHDEGSFGALPCVECARGTCEHSFERCERDGTCSAYLSCALACPAKNGHEPDEPCIERCGAPPELAYPIFSCYQGAVEDRCEAVCD